MAWEAFHGVRTGRTKQNIEQFPKFYLLVKSIQLMFLVKTDVLVVRMHTNKVLVEISISLADSFHGTSILN